MAKTTPGALGFVGKSGWRTTENFVWLSSCPKDIMRCDSNYPVLFRRNGCQDHEFLSVDTTLSKTLLLSIFAVDTLKSYLLTWSQQLFSSPTTSKFPMIKQELNSKSCAYAISFQSVSAYL